MSSKCKKKKKKVKKSGCILTRSEVKELGEVSQSFHIGQKLGGELIVPFDKTKDHPITLTTKKHKLLNVSSGPKDATYRAILKGQISRHLPLLKKSCLGV